MRTWDRRVAWLVVVAAVAVGGLSSAESPSPRSGLPVAAVPVVAAPDSASAMVAARLRGSRVEVVDEGTETRTVFANPDGTHTAEISALPSRVKQGNGWVPIDTTLVSRSDGSVGPRAATNDAALSDGGPTAPLIRLGAGPTEFALYWPGSLPKPVLSGNSATYPEVLPGVDLVMRAEVRGYQQLVVVKSAAAARNAALARIGLRVAARGLRVSADDSGALRAVDEAGTPIWTAAPSVMWDASDPDAPRSAPVGVQVDGEMLTLVPDKDFLADPATVYPVTVDPTFTSFWMLRWANAFSGKPGSTFLNRSADPSHPDWAQVGQCWNGNGSCNGIGEARAYFQFDTRFLAGRDVFWARFYSTVAYSPSCGARAHDLHAFAGDVAQDLRWNNMPSGGLVTRFNSPDSCGPRGIELGIEGWLNGAGSTTFYLQAANGGDQSAWRKYVSGDTHLSVQWNRRPNPPTSLRTDPPVPQPCRWCAGKSYVGDSSIRLIATLSDPDGDRVRANWRVDDPRPGVALVDSEFIPSEWSTPLNVGLDERDGMEVTWWVHAQDEAPTVELSSSGPTFGPSFVVDRQGVDVAPTVSSVSYPEGNAWHGGAGVPGAFVLGSNGVGDIDHFLYGFQDPPADSPDTRVDADSLGGSASVMVTPPGDGPRDLYVQSVDRAGHRSPIRQYHFLVRAGNGPYSRWSLEGNTTDTAFLGNRTGTLQAGVSYTAGAVGTGLLMDGQAGSSMTAPTSVRTDTSFSVSAWVRPDDLPKRVMVAVSQDSTAAGGFSGWYLLYRDDGPGPRWVFMTTLADGANNPIVWPVNGTQVPQRGRWTHLTGVYDQAAGELRLYLDGVPAGAQRLPAGTHGLHAAGPLVFGRGMWQGTKNDWWQGGIDEVQTYDRVLSDVEVRAMVSRDDVRTGHWTFNDNPSTGTAYNSVPGGSDGVLTNGASFVDNGTLGRAVRFDGRDDQVVTGAPAVRTDQSFTVAAWVNAERFTTGGVAMTAVSQDGAQNSGFNLQYNSTLQKWVFVKFSADIPGGPDLQWFAATASQTPAAGTPVHLAGVYDAASKQMQIYVNGEPGNPQSAGYGGTGWTADGPLVIGRAKFIGAQADFWPGTVDEVRTYSRALSAEEIKGIVTRNNVTAGSWKLDGNLNDMSGRGLTGTWTGTPAWTAGQGTDPDSADQAPLLNGANSISTPNAVSTTDSFSVAAWVRVGPTGCNCTVLSQDASTNAGFSLAARTDGRWGMWAATNPGDTALTGDTASAGQVQPGVWTHVVGVYNKQRNQLELYVNGALIATTPHTVTVATTGRLQLGRLKYQGGYINSLIGAIDDVQVYSRALFAEEIRVMAGRDLSLVHNWRLNETTGTTATDAVGARPATLTNGAVFGPGRAGSSARFDGTDDAVSTTGVDLRTDQSFAVSAWVNLTKPGACADVCTRDAVSLSGAPTGAPVKFRLGHRMDQDQAQGNGKWVFEMPERNGAVTKAAVSVDPSEFDSWVLLVGVYDSAIGRIELFVYTDNPADEVDHDSGRLITPWQATGGLQIGRAVDNGVAGEFWKGGVDDIRLYTGTLNAGQLTTLHNSYPAVNR